MDSDIMAKLLGSEENSQKGKFDDEETLFFSRVERVEKNVGFGAVKPWIGAIQEPKNITLAPSVKERKLQIIHANGFRVQDSSNNLKFANESIVWNTAALGIISDEEGKQKIFGGWEDSKNEGHDDDILAIDTYQNLVATGQIGANPLIVVWDKNTLQTLAKFRQGKGTRAVRFISFNSDGNTIGTLAADDHFSAYFFDWRNCKCIAAVKGEGFLMNAFSRVQYEGNTFFSGGKRGIKVWRKEGDGFAASKVTVSSSKNAVIITCIASSNDGEEFCGGFNGEIFCMKKFKQVSSFKAHEGPVTTLAYYDKTLVSGGKDKKLKVFTLSGKENSLTKEREFFSSIHSIDISNQGKFLIGLKNAEIYLEDKMIMRGQHDGESWAIVEHPLTGFIITAADDNKIIVYNPNSLSDVATSRVNLQKVKLSAPIMKKYKGGASTLSKYPESHCCRALALSLNTGNIVVARNDGSISVRENVQKIDQEIFEKKIAAEWIEVMRFSSDETLLAIGSHDNVIYILDAKYSLIHKLNKHSSYIQALDWSTEGYFLQTLCGAYELLFWDAVKGVHLTNGASLLADEQWRTYSSKIGWWTKGIFPKGVDGTHINGVERSHDSQNFLCGDDWGLVNLHSCPIKEGDEPLSYKGHSEHVARVLWSSNDQKVFSLGGQDKTLIIWKVS